MSARGGGGSRPAPRGRPNKVSKPAAGGLKRDPQTQLARNNAARQPALDQLQQLAHDAEAEADHEDDDEMTGPSLGSHHQQHHQHHPHHPFDITAADILAGGPPNPVPSADPDIHPDLHGLPAQFAMEAPMGAHGHGGSGGVPGGVDVSGSAEDVAIQSGYSDLAIDSALAKRLSSNQGQRLAVQRRDDQSLNLKRRSNVEALLAHVSGQEAHSPCKSCHKGYGPWNGCVVVHGQMCGSCANCWFNASGSRCSFHENNVPQHMPAIQVQAMPQLSANASFAGTAPMAPGMAPAGPGVYGQPPGAGPSVDQMVKDVLNRAMSDARHPDPHVRFQYRIETAARQLALVTAEYEEFLSSQGQGQHQPDAEGSVPDADMGEGNNGA
ncbi:hypothetical protein CPLU01_09147 [Colletotrichum plurivorum]|uniref:Uncharacterized protein n=1 Tax=Colletotrichum plurivorum TaxID=2175906 RepID=A0A8H6KAA2_9PEZI|nr:hypothetical protein CPLU01_09147 [Colletotrichum plurivorum]